MLARPTQMLPYLPHIIADIGYDSASNRAHPNLDATVCVFDVLNREIWHLYAELGHRLLQVLVLAGRVISYRLKHAVEAH
ncbi:hypothetical protein BOSE62_30245 [Bosea sp. 62]|nr:hypothetical protein BOSE46_130287 [Bosea sp. 46]CAD5267830.1 hypothetical protein BOSE21B_111379 [Bosea sp. 21B]CAD5271133.1 hypothetical protein BOSE7B_30017 [Bosea sp. 7B]VVT55563.1 hypothetical protein BOS5A_120017 [Bosea sp. EC-HK365B]VXB88252.1 hypothetical protein BOSE29B_130217 [Bosea sp. 29B]VXC15331.1 hypothetical protein BOSE62_30245 [Bosea sp. 62]VXC26781.1 hypothetical protein BOSE125_180342 [Bosea sp. 125]VXC67322.1 hypothetical protein BOSE127_40017 [Bosea sp. 127]